MSSGCTSPLRVRRLDALSAVIEVTGGDPLVRGALRGRRFGAGWTTGAATLLYGVDTQGQPGQVTAVGAAPAVAELLTAIAGEALRLPVGVSLPRGTAVLLGRALRLDDATDWDFRWTATAAPAQPGEERVRLLPDDGASAAAVAALLAAASPTASSRPGDAHVRRWVGVGDPLLAVAADTSTAAGVGHISSVATAPAARGQGLGGAVTAALTRRLLAEGCDVVTLGLYAGNRVARRLYTRLGFVDDHPRSSGLLRPGAD